MLTVTQYSTQHPASLRAWSPPSLAERLAAFVGNPELGDMASSFALCTGLVMAPIAYPQVVRARRYVACEHRWTVPLRTEPDPMLALAFRVPSIATTASASKTLAEYSLAT